MIELIADNRHASLDDRYAFDGKPYYLNGTQSLVRLVQMEQRRRSAAGRRTAVYVTGYRGSPLGSLDQMMGRAAPFLGPDVVVHPAVNEDLAATAVWGTQQLGVFGEGRYDGVSAAWYGKGPGVDRSGDAFKHGNLAGSASEGGVLLIVGDDHTCKSSTTAHQSEFALVDAMIPVLAPASIFEQMAYGLMGWELSRQTGLWAGLKVVTEIMDSSETIDADPVVTTVSAFENGRTDNLSLRWPDSPLAQEERLHRHKLPAALAFARANRLDKIIFGKADARLGVVTVGKAHADTLQALADLGLDEGRAAALGIRLYKVAMPWPLEPQGIREFANGLTDILVIEEKRGLAEEQIRSHLYGRANAPRIMGKHDELGAWLFPSNGDLGAGLIARQMGARLADMTGDEEIARRTALLDRLAEKTAGLQTLAQRPPHFCSGCPHNLSTNVPEGSRAFAGIGCHYLVLPMERQTEGFTQMGGEGANWIGLAPFSKTDHVFQNLGDGTFFHSGSLAIRAAAAAKINITYKILFNGAVAMTGGQPLDGELTPQTVAALTLAEGAKRVVVVTDDLSRYGRDDFPAGVTVSPRTALDVVQRDLRVVQGPTVIIYDQTCATELRRLRKRGVVPDPLVSVFINELVCEGCGDCSRASNCLSIVPLDTEFGRKRTVDLSSCNKDQSCLGGFCPSFVTVEGGRLRKPALGEVGEPGLPFPDPSIPSEPISVVVTGIGGTGVVTIGALIGMAAHLDGKPVRVMDMTGLAQKGGAVVSHIQIGQPGRAIKAAKVDAGAADLLLVCDLVVGAAPDNLCRVSPERGRIIANEHETVTGHFTRDPTLALPVSALKKALRDAVGPERAQFCEATRLATDLVGDAVGANLFLVGFAWQQGLLPVSLAALERAIELNGAAISMNRSAFNWGRRAAVDLPSVEEASRRGISPREQISASLEESIERRVAFLTDYQNAAYARKYSAFVEAVRTRERLITADSHLTEAVCKSLFRLMSYKDEYEVARLHTDNGFIKNLKNRFEGEPKLSFHMAPPLLSKRDRTTGHLIKSKYGAWLVFVFYLLARFRVLRGTTLDVFGYTKERRAERKLPEDYMQLLSQDILPILSARNHAAAVEVAAAMQDVKGFGHIKERSALDAHIKQAKALIRFAEASVLDNIS